MAEESAKLRIPYIAAAQAQKHVTHNEAMTLLDTLVQLSVLDKDLTAPPMSPTEGDCYIVAGGGGTATDAWVGWEQRVARYIDGEWRSYLPGQGAGAGWLAWVFDEDAMYRFDGAAWALAGIEGPAGPEGPAGADGADGQSFQPDAVVALIAGRSTYDDEAAAFSVLVESDSGNDDKPTLYFKLSAGSADWSDGIIWGSTSGAGAVVAPQGRLTLTTGTPVTSADVTAATTIYYTPGPKGATVPLHDGTAWSNRILSGELSLALDSDSGHSGYHQAGKNFDLFVFDDGGTVRLGSSPAWTNDTTRAATLVRVEGLLVNDAAITLRFNAGVSDTVSVDTGLATYVGTFRATANGQTEDSAENRLLWNAYNRAPAQFKRQDTSDTWTYSTAAFHQANASSANQVTMVRGLDEDLVTLNLINAARNASASTLRPAAVAIGLDSTSAKAADCVNYQSGVTNSSATNETAFYAGFPGLGYHALVWLEYADGGGNTIEWRGDLGGTVAQAGLVGMCFR